ncbi:DUF1624 domain-containing protein [Longimicrobium sp.]|jgi:uncharacterized membrane protein|uniref:DUF1624 domain-containing protein n=1 Tax=Longimicrobium sp. TaxID=2029185 RepID=UPI002F95DB62
MQTTRASAPPSADPAHGPVALPKKRVDALDVLRGLVMVLMLLDHTREFVHRDAPLFDAANLDRTTVALFFTRWVTHFCAPIFVLLAGTSVALQLRRGKSKAELSRFLISRGFWLVVLEFTIVRLGIAFDLDYGAFPGMLQVICAIGVSMIVLAAFVHLPVAAAGAVGVAIIALHNLADPIVVQGWGGPGTPGPDALGTLWMVLHQPGFILLFGAPALVAYPLLPWLGVMLAGYALGGVYGWEPARRQRFLARLGLAMVVGFVLLRATNVYGNPSPFTAQKDAAFTVLSFLNTNKYPPSLLFVLMTLGPALLALAWLERVPRGRVGRVLVTFGRVPLFFYVLQWFVAHAMGLGLSLAAGRPTAHLFGFPGGTPPQPGAGFGLGVTYLAWAAGVALTYPLCRWYAGVKQRRTEWWFSYL